MAQAPQPHRRATIPRPVKAHAIHTRVASHERGYDKRWERFRRRFLAEHPLCEYCLAAGRVVEATVVDHDLPHRGDKAAFWGTTYTALCAPCHNGPKARAEARLMGDDLLRWVASRKGKGSP